VAHPAKISSDQNLPTKIGVICARAATAEAPYCYCPTRDIRAAPQNL